MQFLRLVFVYLSVLALKEKISEIKSRHGLCCLKEPCLAQSVVFDVFIKKKLKSIKIQFKHWNSIKFDNHCVIDLYRLFFD